MISSRTLPAEYDAWNRRWHAPFGRTPRWCQLVGFNRFVMRYCGPFAWQPNNDTRRFEYPWAYDVIASRGRPLTIVEVGGGASGMQFVLARDGHRVINVDPGPAAAGKGWPLTEAGHQHLCRVFGTRVELRQTTLDQAGLPDRSADILLCLSVVEHLTPEELDQFVAHAGRVLKPDGLAVFTVDLFLDIWPFSRRPANRWGRNVNIRDLVERAGLELGDGVREELYGFPEFDPQDILANLERHLVTNGYPCLAQCFTAAPRSPAVTVSA